MTPSAGGSRCPPARASPAHAASRPLLHASHAARRTQQARQGGQRSKTEAAGGPPRGHRRGCPQKQSSPTKAACGRQGHTTTGVCFSNSHLALPHARGARAEGLGSRATGLGWGRSGKLDEAIVNSTSNKAPKSWSPRLEKRKEKLGKKMRRRVLLLSPLPRPRFDSLRVAWALSLSLACEVVVTAAPNA